jgi:hypothetical protein
MMPSRTALLALVMMCGGVSGATAQMAPQCNDFMKMRADAEQKAGLIRAASSRHAEPKELCTLLQRFAASEGAMLKFLENNKLWCGVPDQAIKNVKTNHDKTLKMRTAVCSGGAVGEGPRPRAPSLSEALRAPSIDTPANTKTGRGTFDTLTGSPLAR